MRPSIAHGEIQVGHTAVACVSPRQTDPNPASLHLYYIGAAWVHTLRLATCSVWVVLIAFFGHAGSIPQCESTG